MNTRGVGRRTLLAGSAAAGAALAAGAAFAPATARAATPLKKDPFTLGVASGDPASDSVILWTRLAPEPLEESGRGGMPVVAHEVEWEIASDERFASVVARGTAVAQPTFGHAVHVEATGLRPGREYFYRFRTGGWTSPTARTRTTPAPGETPSELALSFASCSRWEDGYFSAYRALADDRPDLVLHLGDYTYEGGAGDDMVRPVLGAEEHTVADYRRRYAQYRTDPDLQAAHAVAPWVTVFDDHEVENNWAGDEPEDQAHEQEEPGWRARRAAAFRAYYENQPMRRSTLPAGPDMRLFRRIEWGDLAAFHMLDTRQYRDNQVPGDAVPAWAPQARTKGRTIMGRAQERWLDEGFRASRARWDLLGNQVFFAPLRFDPVKGDLINPDAWDGYADNRRRVVESFRRSGARNFMVLTGDIHSHWANDIPVDDREPGGPSMGTELITTSITSGGNGFDLPLGWAASLWNPHIKYGNYLRGYVRTRVTPAAVHADFRCVPRVSEPDVQAFTRASFVVADREPRLVRVSENDVAARAGAQRRNPTPAESQEILASPPGS